jgi:hypothetical protein
LAGLLFALIAVSTAGKFLRKEAGNRACAMLLLPVLGEPPNSFA